MTKTFVLIAALALVFAAGAVQAQYTGPWLQVWDFNDGTQGWTKTAGPGYWVDPNVEPNGPVLPDGAPSGAGGGNLYSPDGTVWELQLPSPVTSFILQADFYVPNLMPLNIHPYLPGNGIQGTGVGAVNGYGKVIGAGGRHNPDGIRVKDKSWDNTNRERSWIMEEAGVAKQDMWDKWVTVQLQYNWQNDGMFRMWFYTPWVSGVHPGGWFQLGSWAIHPDGGENTKWYTLRLGATVPDASSWTQTQIDNVKFVPEPASLLALGTGLVGLLGVARRRK